MLAAVGAGCAGLAGCVNVGDGVSEGGPAASSQGGGHGAGSGDTGSDGTDTGSGGTVTVPEPTGECGVANEPLSTMIEPGGGDAGSCSPDRRPSFAVENERSEPVTAAVAVRSGGERVFGDTYELAPGERAVESAPATAAEIETVTVTVDGEELSGSWPELSCRRHAVAIVPDGVEVGYVPLTTGPTDANHDCYAGDPKLVRVGSEDVERVTVTVVDHCAETVREETRTVGPRDVERIEGLLRSGGVYTVVASVEGGGAAVHEYDEGCWGVHVRVDSDGQPDVSRTVPY